MTRFVPYLLLPLFAFGCESTSTPDLVGAWELNTFVYTAEAGDSTYDWYADGLRWTLTFDEAGTLEESWREGSDEEAGNGTWTRDGDTLSLDLDLEDAGDVNVFTVVEVTEDNLSLSLKEDWDFGDGDEAARADLAFDRLP